ncbi:hypothetical protein [Microbacterium sp. RG1]|uniref:hypothetical protein n=1 Tax=Microbacterium sp. RG1 TaxID=2489212 RepID=UPI0010CA4F0B|nr:hypothetical protein [Microbacterium sp. RG1]QCQ15842.1 hypothetical protein EHF32_03335 [Microbacterium sp. RG1]
MPGRVKETGAQYYLIGPNIDALDERLPEEFRGTLIRSTFKPVAVDVIDRSQVEDPRQDLLRTVHELDGSTLVFTGSPEKAEALAVTLGTTSHAVPGGLATEVAGWIASNYDESWDIVAALRSGVAVHTGPLPRGLQRIMVRLFNEGLVGVMVCTSTLIEGVNTSARNVIIFEKKIDGQLIDFFTFSNIRGRAGRMFRHFVGRVVTYMSPPDDTATVVDIPIETQSDLAADADLIQLPNSSLDERAMERVAELFEQDVLSIDTLRRNRGLDPSLQVAAARELRSRPQSSRENLTWQGRPTYTQARETLEFAFYHLLESHQRRGINFNMMWGKLQNARHNAGDLAAQVDQAMTYARQDQDRSDVVTDVLRFQRNWMGHTIPSMLRGLQNIQAEIVSDGPRPNYEYLLREIESLYLPNSVAELEDYGLPTPLAMRLFELGLRRGEVTEIIQDLERVASDPAVTSRLSVVEHWILKDVVSGISGTP